VKERAKERISQLVAKYERLKAEGRLKSYNEEMTKKDFILPLFEALGWDVYNTNVDEVSAEEKVSKGRVDYGFRIAGIPKFFLEAKALKADLEDLKWAEQAINYSWHKGVVWAVLTDFETVRVFNAEVKTANPAQSQFFALYTNQFLDRFEQLWLLSHESFEKGLINEEAEKWGKKLKKIPVDKQLLSDFTSFRELLSKSVLKNNPQKKLTEEDIDESVQRILDRLIFIRTTEDKEIEPPHLMPLLREDTGKRVLKKLNVLFRYYDEIYNSKLFQPHLCEDLEIDDHVLEHIIQGLYCSKEWSIHYNFALLDADILGSIYEQYLGHILKKTEKRATLTEGKIHRKEQGIYYTPTYIVDYIVKNTIGELAKDKKFDMDKIKILDPACGSGSFLIKAFDFLNQHHSRKGTGEQTKIDTSGVAATFTKKLELLKNNIYGVDLDPKAVEIAQLNLLLKAAEKKHRLPTLQNNIKCGNSLIDDPNIAGQRAFKWEDEFSTIMKDGGFDVVIGNPPYGASFNTQEKEYFNSRYTYVKSVYESYRLFIELASKLVKDRGYMGLIVPNTWFYLTNAENMRKEILSNYSVTKLINLPQSVFEDATVDTCIIIFRKEPPKNNQVETHFFNYKDKINSLECMKYSELKQNDFLKNAECIININRNAEDVKLISKIKKQPQVLDEYVTIITGIKPYQVGKGVPPQTKKDLEEKNFTATYQKDKSFKPWLTGKFISRYQVLPNKEFIKYGAWLAEPKIPDIFEKDRIVLQQIRNPSLPRRIIATFIKGGIYTNNGIHNLIPKNDEQTFWILGILNSKLMNYYFASHYNDVNIKPSNLYSLPYPVYDNKSKLSELVSKIVFIGQKLTQLEGKQTDEQVQLEKEFKKLDKEIDEKVYEIYGLNESERKVIEDHLKSN